MRTLWSLPQNELAYDGKFSLDYAKGPSIRKIIEKMRRKLMKFAVHSPSQLLPGTKFRPNFWNQNILIFLISHGFTFFLFLNSSDEAGNVNQWRHDFRSNRATSEWWAIELLKPPRYNFRFKTWCTCANFTIRLRMLIDVPTFYTFELFVRLYSSTKTIFSSPSIGRMFSVKEPGRTFFTHHTYIDRHFDERLVM